ncbi:MAG: flagellar biosynthesis protein FlhB [Proteobacteria bacterium]|nr:flagellar biosynthesis protein FlhB [Pseudomonadota bacterium]
MSDDPESKTEEPSGKRLGDAREKGQVAQSREVAHLIMVSAMLVVILMLGPLLTRDLALMLRRFVELPHQIRIDHDDFHFLMVDMSGQLAAVLAVPLLLLLLAAFAPSLLQNGFLWSTQGLTPQLSRISPFSGLKRLFSLRNVTELAKGIVKMALVGIVATVLLLPLFGYVEQYISTDVLMLLPQLLTLSVKLLSGVIAILVLVAGADYIYQRYEFMKSLRMTKQEVKDEFKQMEGDPVIKSALRRIRQQRARTRMMAAVPTATVVVTNPTHFACALKYDPGMNAPVLLAKGADLLALRIIDKAREHFIPVVENPPLARTLFASVEVDAEIPREHYKAVAEVIGFVMRMKKRAVH